MAKTARTLQLTAGTTQTVGTLNFNGSVGVIMGLSSTSTSPAYITSGNNPFVCDYIAPSYVNTSGSLGIFATNSTNAGTSNFIFIKDIQVQIASVWKAGKAMQIKVNGAWKAVSKAQLYISGAWRTVY